MSTLHKTKLDRIKKLAKQQGLTMKYFCDCFGKHRSYLTSIRNGNGHLDENELQFIADKLNTTVEYLTDQTDDPAKPAEKEKPDAITDAEQAEFDLRFSRLSPERQDFVLRLLELALAEQEKEEREKGEDVRQTPKQPE